MATAPRDRREWLATALSQLSKLMESVTSHREVEQQREPFPEFWLCSHGHKRDTHTSLYAKYRLLKGERYRKSTNSQSWSMKQLLNSVSAVHFIPFQDSYPTRLEIFLQKYPLPFSYQPPITFILRFLPGSIVLKTYLPRHWVYGHFSQAWPGHRSFHETAFLFVF